MRRMLIGVCLYFFSFIMFIRAISENLLRTGSYITDWVYEGVDIKTLAIHPKYDVMQTILVIFQTSFPTLIGFIMLYVYYYLGVHSETMINCIDGVGDETTLLEEESN